MHARRYTRLHTHPVNNLRQSAVLLLPRLPVCLPADLNRSIFSHEQSSGEESRTKEETSSTSSWRCRPEGTVARFTGELSDFASTDVDRLGTLLFNYGRRHQCAVGSAVAIRINRSIKMTTRPRPPFSIASGFNNVQNQMLRSAAVFRVCDCVVVILLTKETKQLNRKCVSCWTNFSSFLRKAMRTRRGTGHCQ